MSEIKLKPCPFCGTKAYTRISGIKGEELQGYISCNNPKCAVGMNFSISPTHVLLNFEDVISGFHEAAERWNERVEE